MIVWVAIVVVIVAALLYWLLIITGHVPRPVVTLLCDWTAP